MRIPGWKFFKKSVRWTRSRFVNHAIILGYHRVSTSSIDPFSMCVTPQHFADQLEVLYRYANPISLQELMSKFRNGSVPKRSVALTFDDGYADVLANAKPLLERYRIPASVFISTGYIGSKFWWDELAQIILTPKKLPVRLSLRINSNSLNWVSDENNSKNSKKQDFESRQYLIQSLYQHLLQSTPLEIQKVIAQLRIWAGVRSIPHSQSRTLTLDELIDLSTSELFDIGAHSVAHPLLVNLSIEEQREEIHQSKMWLEKLLGRSVDSFAYPNGSFSLQTLTVVRELGFRYACGSQNDIVWRGSNSFNLARFWIPDWDGDQFYRWLRFWI